MDADDSETKLVSFCVFMGIKCVMIQKVTSLNTFIYFKNF